ncbi:MAG: PorT family protein [Bacteroidia bacterium]|nr:PorT family protein [Bacteroidia bacterium]
MKSLKLKTTFISLLLAVIIANAQSDSSKANKPVIINGKKIKITIDTKETHDKNKNTEIIIKDDTLKIGHVPEKNKESNKKKVEKKHKKESKNEPKVKSHWFAFDWGLNFLEYNKTLDMPENYKELDLDNGKGCEFNLRIFEQEVSLVKNNMSLVYGVGVDWNNYRFKNNVDLLKDSSILKYTLNTNIDYKKNKLVSNYLTVPILIKMKFGKSKKNDSFKIAFGPQIGYLLNSYQKRKWESNGKQKTKVKGDYNIDELRIGYSLYLGSNDINFYFRYFPESTFKKDKGPNVNTACVGIVFRGF